MNDLCFVTGNKGKLASARKYASEYDIELSNIDLDTEESNVNDIERIAIEKVMKAYEIIHKPCIANDSGFYIEAYPNNPYFPGAFVKRELLIPIGIEKLMDIMKDVKNRNCFFEDCTAYYDGNTFKTFHSTSKGILSNKIYKIDSDKKWSQLWYVFIPEGYNKTLSLFSEEELIERRENKTSALRETLKWYSKINKKTIK